MKGYVSGKPDVAWWLHQIREGVKFRKKYAREDMWQGWRDAYRGNWKHGTLPSNLFFKMLRATVPRIYFRNPAVSVSPAKPGMLNWAFAKILERIDNRLIRDMSVKSTMKTAISRAFLYGTGVGKIGFSTEFSAVDIDHGAPRKNGRRLEYNSLVKDGMPWFLSPSTGSFIVPNLTTKLASAPWVAEWITRPLDDVKADDRLRNVADMAPTSVRDTDLIGGTKILEREETVDLLEIRDKRNGKVMIISPNMKSRVHLFEDDELQYNGSIPYLDLVFNEDEEVFWGVPDSMILEPHQREINEIRTQQMMHRRLALVRFLYDSGKVKEEEIQKIFGEDILAAIKVMGDPKNVIESVAVDIPDALFKFDLQVMSDVRENLGFSRNEFGEMTPPEARTSATEIAVVRAATQIRVDERRDMVADMLVKMIEYIHQIIFNHWSLPQIVDVTGPMGVPIWVTVNPSALGAAKYNINVDPDSAIPETRAVRRQNALQAYTLLAQNPLMDPIKLTMYLVNELGMPQLDDLMPMFPPLAGSMANPMSPEQFGQFSQQLAQRGIPTGQQAGRPNATGEPR